MGLFGQYTQRNKIQARTPADAPTKGPFMRSKYGKSMETNTNAKPQKITPKM